MPGQVANKLYRYRYHGSCSLHETRRDVNVDSMTNENWIEYSWSWSLEWCETLWLWTLVRYSNSILYVKAQRADPAVSQNSAQGQRPEAHLLVQLLSSLCCALWVCGLFAWMVTSCWICLAGAWTYSLVTLTWHYLAHYFCVVKGLSTNTETNLRELRGRELHTFICVDLTFVSGKLFNLKTYQMKHRKSLFLSMMTAITLNLSSQERVGRVGAQ